MLADLGWNTVRQMTANYAFKPTAEQALRSSQSRVPRRLNAALASFGSFIARNFVVVKEGTELTLEPDCRMARGGYTGGGGRRRAVCGRVPLGASPVGHTAQTSSPACRIVRGGYKVGGGRRRAVGGRVVPSLRNVAWVPGDLRPACRIVRGGSLWVGVRRRAACGRSHLGCILVAEELTCAYLCG